MSSRGRREQHESRSIGACVEFHVVGHARSLQRLLRWRAARLTLGLLTLAAVSACSSSGASTDNAVSNSTAASSPLIHLQPSPSQVVLGNGTSLVWDVQNADSCTASGGWSGTKPVSGSATIESLATNTTFTLVCAGPGGSAVEHAEVVVTAPAPSVSLSAKANTVEPGAATVLNWSSTNATGCSAAGGWSGNLPASGSQTTAALTGTTNFTISCTGTGGSATQSTTVTVVSPAPTISISAAPSSLSTGASSTLTWSSIGATSCAASGAWTGPEPVSGSHSTGPLTADSTYTLNCTGPGGTATQSVSISVLPVVPKVSFGAVPSTITQGSATTLSWSSANATSCVAGGSWSGGKALAGSQSTGNLTATTSYSLTCSGPGGTAKQSTTVTVAASNSAPTVNLSVGPSAVVSGGSAMINWSATNATACMASGGWAGSHSTHGSQSTGALTASTSYTLTCSGPHGSAAQTATVSVTAAPPVITFNASPSTVKSGAASTLTWLSTNSDVCTASGAWTGAHSGHGSVSTGPLTSAKTYTITCQNAGGSASQSVTVSVGSATPSVTLTATPTTVKSGVTTTLAWSASNASSCAASGGWTGAKAASGTQATVPLSATTQFSLTCSGSGGFASQSVTVTVAAAAPSVSLTANPTAITSGGTALLTWSSTNATSCTASGGWAGPLGTSGSRSTPALTASTTYTVSCTGTAGSASTSATVTVSAAQQPSSGTATLSWSAPTVNTDGTPVTPLTGYTIYYGTTASALTQSVVVSGPSTLSHELSGLSSGTWYFAVAANAADGTVSAPSTIGSKTI